MSTSNENWHYQMNCSMHINTQFHNNIIRISKLIKHIHVHKIIMKAENYVIKYVNDNIIIDVL